jgi:preprotein translocase subunit SecD
MEKQALLEFKLVDEKADVGAALKGVIPPEDQILYQMDRNSGTGKVARRPHVVKKEALMRGDVLTDARVQPSQTGRMLIWVAFNSEGSREFETITSEHISERLAIILDNRVYSAPAIRDRVSAGAAIIEGIFTPEEAEELALVLRCGPIVTPMGVVKSEWLKPPPGSR